MFEGLGRSLPYDSCSGSTSGAFSGFGAASECGPLRAVLLHRPGAEIDELSEPSKSLWRERPDPSEARRQHDGLAELFRSRGVSVSYVNGRANHPFPNLCFVRDTFAMTPEGAILSRPGTAVRFGEENLTAQALAELGIPILLTVHGAGRFEGGDLMIAGEDLALIAVGNRTNEDGAAQVKRALLEVGIGEVATFGIGPGALHLDCTLALPARKVAVAQAGKVSIVCRHYLGRHGYRVFELDEEEEVGRRMSINVVAVGPGAVVMPAGNPRTKRMLEGAGIECLEAEISELAKGAGGVHCLTGVLRRDEA